MIENLLKGCKNSLDFVELLIVLICYRTYFSLTTDLKISIFLHEYSTIKEYHVIFQAGISLFSLSIASLYLQYVFFIQLGEKLENEIY